MSTETRNRRRYCRWQFIAEFASSVHSTLSGVYHRLQVSIQPRLSAVNKTLPAFAAEMRRRCCCSCQSISGRRGALSSNPPNGWRRGVVVSGVRRMNEVNARRARLVPG